MNNHFRHLALAASLLLSFVRPAAAQEEGVTHSGRPTGQPPCPLTEYRELPNPVAADAALWQKMREVTVGWGSTDVRYAKERPAAVASSPQLRLTAWRGERVSAQAVVSTPRPLNGLKFSVGELTSSRGGRIAADRIFTGFVRYVMTDELNKDGRGGCGYRPDNSLFDSTLVADPIDHLTPVMAMEPHTTQACWIRVWVPSDTPAGRYSGKVSVEDEQGELGVLSLSVDVLERSLPSPRDWAFHLDLWQNPYAVARYHQVEPWSEQHMEALRPYMELYRDAGGKSVTASIMHKPWNAQTHDYFESMVTWVKRLDGTWYFDYAVFDKWVEFMFSLGIDKQINCYSMVPWKLTYRYFDQATNSMRSFSSAPGEELYDKVWGEMLTSFAEHLKQKGWFEKTLISMDERPEEVMQRTLNIIRKADPGFKISLAGALHESLADELDDYCVSLNMKFKKEEVDKRRAEGRVTTFYTSCSEPRPNTFTFSEPAESEWLGWYAAGAHLDGYLRWALNSWVLEPLLDSRFHTWAAGDTYLIYPGGRTSVRFERLMEGVQAWEKVRILREEYTRRGDTAALKRLEKTLSAFDETTLGERPAAEVIRAARREVNRR